MNGTGDGPDGRGKRWTSCSKSEVASGVYSGDVSKRSEGHGGSSLTRKEEDDGHRTCRRSPRCNGSTKQILEMFLAQCQDK